ncbi:glycerophosphodiester phosphodiesterase family protein [Paenibacillus sp. FSL H8-0537]|uniref:glycerophosphodiester phosphodiesterase n=1 Tax=Paenibacillus sp. FSL H8-0537 TaxID=2921399 RepID=UPI003100CBA9
MNKQQAGEAGENKKQAKRPLIIGHRGAAGEAPENTLASFQLAADQGCDMVELDIHLSADDKLVVCHDATLDRTTTQTGLIRSMNYEAISKADAGSKFAEAFRGQRAPLLEEVYALLPKPIEINVEAKDSYNGALDEALDVFLQQPGRMERTVVSSFDHKLLARLKARMPELRIGLLYGAALIAPAAYAGLMGCEVFSLHPHYSGIDAEDTAEAAKAKIAVYPYTVNEEQDFLSLIDRQVDGIITDFPGRLKQLLDKQGGN